MSAPTTDFTFDTNKTNTTALPSAMKTDGWTSGSSIASDFLNYWQGAVSDWLAYLAALAAATRTVPLDLASGQVWGSGSTAPLTLSGSTRYILITSSVAEIDFAVSPPVGSTISELKVAYNREGAATVGITLARYSAAGAETVIASLTDTASSGDTSKSLSTDATFGALPYTTAADESIALTINGATNVRIYGVWLSYTLPA